MRSIVGRLFPILKERGINARVTTDQQPSRPAQRLRLTFSKDGPARYISHLDLARALERSLNRAELPVAYTQGFNRRPRLSLAAALPLGYTSAAEVADVWLLEPIAAEVFQERLAARLAPGLGLLAVAEIPLAAPSAQGQLVAAAYEVAFPFGVDAAALRAAVAEVLAAESLMRDRRRAKDTRPQPFDLRPLILAMHLAEDGDGLRLYLELAHTPTATGRPDDVLAALGLDPLDAHVHRVALRFAD